MELLLLSSVLLSLEVASAVLAGPEKSHSVTDVEEDAYEVLDTSCFRLTGDSTSHGNLILLALSGVGGRSSSSESGSNKPIRLRASCDPYR